MTNIQNEAFYVKLRNIYGNCKISNIHKEQLKNLSYKLGKSENTSLNKNVTVNNVKSKFYEKINSKKFDWKDCLIDNRKRFQPKQLSNEILSNYLSTSSIKSGVLNVDQKWAINSKDVKMRNEKCLKNYNNKQYQYEKKKNTYEIVENDTNDIKNIVNNDNYKFYQYDEISNCIVNKFFNFNICFSKEKIEKKPENNQTTVNIPKSANSTQKIIKSNKVINSSYIDDLSSFARVLSINQSKSSISPNDNHISKYNRHISSKSVHHMNNYYEDQYHVKTKLIKPKIMRVKTAPVIRSGELSLYAKTLLSNDKNVQQNKINYKLYLNKSEKGKICRKKLSKSCTNLNRGCRPQKCIQNNQCFKACLTSVSTREDLKINSNCENDVVNKFFNDKHNLKLVKINLFNKNRIFKGTCCRYWQKSNYDNFQYKFQNQNCSNDGQVKFIPIVISK
ncbi:hypothetical protein A3Q56_05890 [Intoshia linei]|uniref:Uncharacterized protein n=1 Tax=Intoshia linei TaxID=1819745 RepID=A0A177AYY1_9BILA|nr:hypothetical protein A3Q56_05890 [Intoshia linei]